MIFNDYSAYIAKVRSWIEEPSGDHGTFVANYYENPHFEGVITNFGFWLNSDSQLIVTYKCCKLSKSFQNFQQLGIIHFPPEIIQKTIIPPEGIAKHLLALIDTIHQKETWAREDIYLDGIHRELRINHADSSFLIKWNMKSNNIELNQFVELIEALKAH